MEEDKKELSHEEQLEKEKQEIKRLEKEAELEKLQRKKAELHWQSRERKASKLKDGINSVGKILGNLFEGVPALGNDLKPIEKKKEETKHM
jgi:hypothetical protein